MTCTAEDLIAIIKDYVPEHIFNHYEERITSECNGRAVHDTQNNCSLIIGKEKNTYWDYSKSENYIAYDIAWYPTENKTSSTVTKKSIVTNGKYYYTYKYYIPASSTYSSIMSLRYYPTSNTYDISTSSGASKWGSDVTITTTDTMSAELYLSPRCKLIYE